MADVVFAARALGNLLSVRSWLRERDSAAADRVVGEIERACLLLGEHPLMGSVIAGTGLRRHVTRRYRYRLIYRVAGDTVEVRAVLHPSRADRT